MTLFVIRHASAGTRGQFAGDDRLRPLDAGGVARSDAIADELDDRPISRLLSSEALRCTQTLGSLSHRLGHRIEIHPALLEGAGAVAMVELLRESAVVEGDVALCSHGDMIPAALSILMAEGMVVVGRRDWAKGSIWELEVVGRDIVSARYRSGADVSPDLAST